MTDLNKCALTVPDKFKIAADSNEKGIGKIEGYFALYGTPSEPIYGSYVWELADGIFEKALKEKKDQTLLAHHDFEQVLGARDSKTAKFKADAEGLFGSCDIPDTTYGRNLLVSMKRGDIKATSFGFIILDYKYLQAKGQLDKQMITEVELWEGSVVTVPRFSATKGRVNAILPAGLTAPLEASLFRALNRAENDLEFEDEDKTILSFYRSSFEAKLPDDFRKKLEKRGVNIAGQVFEISKGADPLAYALWAENLS